MSRYGLGRYNLARYNIPTDKIQYVDFVYESKNIIECVVGARVDMDFMHFTTAQFIHDLTLNMMLPRVLSFNAVINQSGSMFMGHTAIFDSKSEFMASIHASKTMNEAVEYAAQIDGKTHLGKIIHTAAAFVDNDIRASVYLGKYMNFIHNIPVMIVGLVEIGMTRYFTFTLMTTIPPGGEIRIDSSVFTALRGQENILHEYSGDWIHLVPGTKKLIIESISGGNLDGLILYNARYL